MDIHVDILGTSISTYPRHISRFTAQPRNMRIFRNLELLLCCLKSFLGKGSAYHQAEDEVVAGMREEEGGDKTYIKSSRHEDECFGSATA